MMNIVATEHAPAAVGPYAQGIVLNGMLLTSGQLVEGDIRDGARRCLDNIDAIEVADGTAN